MEFNYKGIINAKNRRIKKLLNENQQLHYIIKQVREYIEEHAKWDYSGGTEEEHLAEWYDLDITSSMFIRELLEILDKVYEENK